MATLHRVVSDPPPRQTPPLNVELLEEIFLRLSSPVDLARASAACFTFRQAIADPLFLRQYRAVHPPRLLGGFHPVEAAHPNAASARALASAADGGFDFGYLPQGGWCYAGVCEGRVLLQRIREGVVLPELAVCDPLFKRYKVLPPIPRALILSAQIMKHSRFEAFLVPCGNMEDTSFKVISMTHCIQKVVVFILSSDDYQWSVAASSSWSNLGFIDSSIAIVGLSWSHYKHGYFYWGVGNTDKLLKLDVNRMQFSSVELPAAHNYYGRQVVIVEDGEEGKLGIISHLNHEANAQHYTSTQNGGASANQWRMEREIQLPVRSYFVGVSEGHIFMEGFVQKRSRLKPEAIYSLELKSLKVERVCSTKFVHRLAHPYFGYPPFLSPRRI